MLTLKQPAVRAAPATATRRRRAPAALAGLGGTYWTLWTGTLVNRLGTFVEPFLILDLTTHRGFSIAAAGGALTVYGAGAILAQPLGGVLADRIGRVPVLAGGMLANGAANLLLGAARSPSLLVVTALAAGITVDLYRPASRALLADIVAPGDLGRAFTVQFWAVNLGYSVATSLAGFLAVRGYWLLFAGDAATSTATAVLIAVRIRGHGRARQRERRAAGEGGSLLTALRDPLLLAATGISMLFATVYGQVFATLPLAITDAGIPVSRYGLLLAINGVLIVVLQPLLLGRLGRLPRTPLLAASQLLVGIGFALTAFAHSTVAFLGVVIVWTVGEIGNAGLMNGMVARLAPAHLRGRYNGVYGLARAGGAVFAPAVGTTVYADLGPGWVWAGCAIAGLALFAGQFLLGAALARRLP